MLHIILGILRILGILLLAVLVLMAVVLLLVLFVPLRYRLQADVQKELCVRADIRWMFRLLHMNIEYQNKKLRYALKVLGHAFISSAEGTEDAAEEIPEEAVREPEQEFFDESREEFEEIEKAEVPEETEEAEEIEAPEETEAPGETEEIEAPEEAEAPEEIEEIETPGERPGEADHIVDVPKQETVYWEEETYEKKRRWNLQGIFGKIKGLWRKIKQIFAGLTAAFRNIRETVSRIKQTAQGYLKFWHDEKTQAAWRHAKREAACLIRHIRPRKLEGNLLFGLEDPASTGKILGALCVLEGFFGNHLQVEADFERKVMEGNVFLKGHVRGCHFVKAFLGLLFDKNIRITIKRFLKMSKR